MRLRYFMDDIGWTLIFIVVGVAVIIGVGFLIGDLYASYACSNYQEITGKTTKFARFDSCYVETDDGFQRWDEYKARAVASEGLKGGSE